MNNWLGAGRAIVWNGDVQNVLNAVTPLIVQEPARDVWVLPRKSDDMPVIVHVVNHSYNDQTDSMNVQSDITVILKNDLLDWMPIKDVTAYSPDNEPVTLPFEITSGSVSITIPEVEYWTILKVERGETLPVAGILSLGLLAAACALGGALVLRKKS